PARADTVLVRLRNPASPLATFWFNMIRPPPTPTLFPSTTLFRSAAGGAITTATAGKLTFTVVHAGGDHIVLTGSTADLTSGQPRSEAPTAELQPRRLVVCRPLQEQNHPSPQDPRPATGAAHCPPS